MLLHALTRTHTHTHTHYMKVILRNQALTWFNSFHVILCTHNILVSLFIILAMYQIFKATKYTSILQSSNVRVRYMHAMLSFNNTNHHMSDTPSKRLGGVLYIYMYVHMFVIYNVLSTVYCPLNYLGYTVFSHPYLSVYL